MNEYKLQLTTELIYQLLKGKKLEQIFNNEIRFTILPPQEGVFITIEELNKIVSDRTNMTERLLKLSLTDRVKDIGERPLTSRKLYCWSKTASGRPSLNKR